MKKSILIPILLTSMLTGCGNNPAPSTPAIYYDITILNSEHGSVSADKTKVEEGDLVTFTFTMDQGYELSSFVVNNEEVTVLSDHYTVVNVKEDLTVKATFEHSLISVRYFNDDELIMNIKVKPGEDASYFGPEPTKKMSGVTIYEFEGWSKQKNGQVIYNFKFIESTDLYAVYSEHSYEISMTESLEFKPFETKSITVTSTYPEVYMNSCFVLEDPTICDIDENFNVTAKRNGETDYRFVVNGVAAATCHIKVQSLDNVKAAIGTALCFVLRTENRILDHLSCLNVTNVYFINFPHYHFL